MDGLKAQTAQKTYENMLVPKIENYNYQDDNYKKIMWKYFFSKIVRESEAPLVMLLCDSTSPNDLDSWLLLLPS